MEVDFVSDTKVLTGTCVGDEVTRVQDRNYPLVLSTSKFLGSPLETLLETI